MVNTADLQISRIQSGVSLAKMTLCELCGIALDGDIQLADEGTADLSPTPLPNYEAHSTAYSSDSTAQKEARPELRLLQNAVDLSEQNTKLVLCTYLVSS